MCELFGASSIEKAEYKDLLREFYSHDVRNPHGWGIAVREGDRLLVKKEPVRASASEILAGIMERPIRTDLLLAHVRLATKGSIEYENTHPFVQKDVSGQTWTLIHNGTIFESSILDQYVNRQVGSTDSERILCHLIARMNSALRETGTQRRAPYPQRIRAGGHRHQAAGRRSLGGTSPQYASGVPGRGGNHPGSTS